MPLEFALRPRFRLHESAAPPRRSRPKLPRMVLPIAGYWLGMAVLTHALIIAVKSEDAEASESFAPPQEQAYAPAQAPALQVEPPALEPVPAPEPSAAPGPALLETPAEEPIARQPEEAEETFEPPAWDPAARRLPEPIARAPESRETPAPPQREPAIERAITSFVEPREEPEPAPAPAPPRESPREPPVVASTLPSCEAIIASSSQDIDIRKRDNTPDLAREDFSRVLDHGGYLAGCSVPERTTVEICVAVQAGQARGVSVVTKPGSAAISACVKNAVARLRFPYSRRLDVARTRFEASR